MDNTYFTDQEYRIILIALRRNRKICEKIDGNCVCKTGLLKLMDSIERKMKYMAKYKVGDKVRVRRWEDMEAEFGLYGDSIAVPCGFLPEMKEYCGKMVTIESASKNGPYIIEEGGWSWSDGMFESACEMNKVTYKPGDKVRIKNRRGRYWNDDGLMDKWMNQIMTLRSKTATGSWRMEEDKKENMGSGWCWEERDFELVEGKETIVIYREGQKTIALHKIGNEVVKKEIAKCCPNDKYKFKEGAKIAFDRLVGDDGKTTEDEIKLIEIGNKVKVVNIGHRYTTYKGWFSMFAPDYSKRYEGCCLDNGSSGVVVAKHKHEIGDSILCAVLIDGGKVGLIGEKGLENIE